MPRPHVKIISPEQLRPGTTYRAYYRGGVLEFTFVRFVVAKGGIEVHYRRGDYAGSLAWLDLASVRES